MTEERLMFEAATAARELEKRLHQLWDGQATITPGDAAELVLLARTVNCAVTELANRAQGVEPPKRKLHD